uniref:Tyrosine-protein phosphatase domain-containing protein n=1 Tax=Strongyloides papillosus TaxID=174720 RepID=A0A0N5B9Q0_STREA
MVACSNIVILIIFFYLSLYVLLGISFIEGGSNSSTTANSSIFGSDIILIKCNGSDISESNSTGDGKISTPSIVKIKQEPYLIVEYRKSNLNISEHNNCLEGWNENTNLTMVGWTNESQLNIVREKIDYTTIKLNESSEDLFITHKNKNNSLKRGYPSFINSFDGLIIYHFNVTVHNGSIVNPFKISNVINGPISYDVLDYDTFFNTTIKNEISNSSTLILSNVTRIDLEISSEKDKEEFFNKYDITLNYCLIINNHSELSNSSNLPNISIFDNDFTLHNDIFYYFEVKCKTCEEVYHKLQDQYFLRKKCNDSLFDKINNETKIRMKCNKLLDNQPQGNEQIRNVTYTNGSIVYNGITAPVKVLTDQCPNLSSKNIPRNNDPNPHDYLPDGDYNKQNGTTGKNVENEKSKGKKSLKITIIQIFFFIFLILSVIIGAAISIRWCITYFIKKHNIQDDENNTILKKNKIYPNIQEWWNNLVSTNFVIHCQSVYDFEYQSTLIEDFVMPDKIKELTNKTIDKKEGSNVKALSKTVTTKEKHRNSYTISNVSLKRNYIMAKKFYCPSKPKKYGEVHLEFMEVNQLQNIDILFIKLKLTHSSGLRRRLWVYFAPDVSDIHKPPSKGVDNKKQKEDAVNNLNIIPYIYEHILKSCGSRKILIHSDNEISKSVLIVTYFCCVVDGMMTDFSITNPLKIIKKVRSIHNSHNFGAIDYGYLIRILTRYFCSENYMLHTDYETSIDNAYNKYKILLGKRCNKEFYEMLSLENIQDMIYGLWKNYIIGDKTELESKCKTWFEIYKLPISKQIIRSNKFSCFEDDCIIFDNQKNSDQYSGFLNGNFIEYGSLQNIKRRLIMCQAPTQYTYMSMIGYLYSETPATIVITTGSNEKLNDIAPYLFKNDNKNKPIAEEYTVDVGKNLLTNLSSKEFIENCDIYQMTIKKKGEKNTVEIKVFHYKEWPQRGIPLNYQDIVKLIKAINGYGRTKSILIHGKDGIGRTGSIATLLYMIDMIEVNNEFNPLDHLNDIRDCRYGAVETREQFLFILMVFSEIFRDSIEVVNPGATNRYLKLLHNLIYIDFRTEIDKKGGNI